MSELEVVDWANSREDLLQLDHDAPLAEILEIIRRHKYSRYPVYDSARGEYVGLLHIKDLLLALAANGALAEDFCLVSCCVRWSGCPSTCRWPACWNSSARAARISCWSKKATTRSSAS